MTLETLINSALRVLLLGAAVWVALRIARVRNPHVEALVWRMVLIASLALPALLYWRLAPSFETSLDLPVIATDGVGAKDAPAATSSSAWLTARILVSIYLGIALLLLVRLVSGLAFMWRVSRAARPMATPDDIRISAQVRSPATFGTIVLLPDGAHAWPAQRLDAILEHERAHVRWRDGYWSWLAQIHTAIFWFSPLAWWLQRRLETLAETTSDDAVVGARHDPIAYAALLLDFARPPNSRSVAMSVAESNVPERIERLLARTPPAAALPRVIRWSAFVALIPIAVFAASTTRAAPTEHAAIARIVRTANPDHYYPAVAKHEKVTGSVVVEVDVDVLGQLVDARVVEAEPADPRYGFADAALEVARNTTYGNPHQRPASLRFKVKFELTAAPADATPAMAAARSERLVAATSPMAAQPVRLRSVADPDNYYPPLAKQEKVSGYAVVEVAVDPSGKVVNAVVLEEQPADPRYGFGAAAMRVAQNNQYQNPNAEVSTMKFKVKFALEP
jgi:TonB family protein